MVSKRCIIDYVEKCPIHHCDNVGLDTYCKTCEYNKGIYNHYIYCSFGDIDDD